MNKLALATAALAALVTSSFAAAAQSCKPVAFQAIQEAGAGYVSVGVRRPFVASPNGISDMLVEVKVTNTEQVRLDTKDEAKSWVLGAATCGDTVIRYQVRAKPMGDNEYHVAKLMLPAGAPIKIRSCSAIAKQCYEGTWDGTESVGVTLKAFGAKGAAPDAGDIIWK